MIASGCAAPWGGTPNATPGATATPAGSTAASFPAAAPNPGAMGKNGASAPTNPLALARLSERRRQTEEAERLYLEVIRQSPNNPVPHHRLAVIYTKQGRFKEAEEHFNRALALKPDDPELLNDLGYFYHLASRPKEAEQCLRRAVEIEPANRAYCNNLALVLAEQGRREECLNLFRRAGSEKEARANYAFVLAQQGEYQQALDLYDRVLTEDQSLRAAADAMIELSQRVSAKKPSRSAAPPDEQPPAIAATRHDPNGENPAPALATGTPCAYTAPATASAPPTTPPTAPQANRAAASPQYASTPSPLSPPPLASPWELQASPGAPRPAAPSAIPSTPVDYGATPEATPRPALHLFAERVILIAVAGAIFWGIAVARRLGRKHAATGAGPGLRVQTHGTGRMRPKAALAAVSNPAAGSARTLRPRRRR